MTAKVALAVLVLGCILPLVLNWEISSGDDGKRWRRQAAAGDRNFSIPVSPSFYPGVSQIIDSCQRSEVQFPGGACYHLLTQGPCQVTEFVLLDPDTNRGYCAPRLCAPDRIFVFDDQLCHDPRDPALCPPGRRLFYTAFGTPICQCPSGTYEAIDSLYEDVCEPILGKTRFCPYGKVLWFRDFSLPWECLPDPCGGLNLQRGPNDAAFVPSASEYGKCYQLGQMSGVCPAQTWYSLALDRLQGVCSTLEDAGYQVFDPETLAFFSKFYGPLISSTSQIGLEYSTGSITEQVFGSIGGSNVYESNDVQSAFDGQGPSHLSTVYGTSSSVDGTTSQSRSNLKVEKLDPIVRVKGIMAALNGAFPNLDVLNLPVDHKLYAFMETVKAITGDLVSGRGHHRNRRQNTPSQVFEIPLGDCKAGGAHGANLKCRENFFPSNSSSNGNISQPVRGQPSCPEGQVQAVKGCASRSTSAPGDLG